MGMLSGLSVGWLFFSTRHSCSELVSGPRQWWLEPSYLLPLTSYLLPLTSYLLPLTSHLLPLTSYLLPLTSYLLPLTSCLLPLTSPMRWTCLNGHVHAYERTHRVANGTLAGRGQYAILRES